MSAGIDGGRLAAARTRARPPYARSVMRIGLASMAFEALLIGVPASVVPEAFFRWFLLGRGWAGAIGPYNGHYVRDAGFLYVALAVILVWAGVRLGRDLVSAAVVGFLVATVPHLLLHLSHTRELSVADNVAQDGLLGVSVAVPCALLWLLHRDPRVVDPATVSRSEDRPPVPGRSAG